MQAVNLSSSFQYPSRTRSYDYHLQFDNDRKLPVKNHVQKKKVIAGFHLSLIKFRPCVYHLCSSIASWTSV